MDPLPDDPRAMLLSLARQPDDTLLSRVRRYGVDRLMGEVLTGLADHYRPERGHAADGALLFVAKDHGAEHVHTLHLSAEGAWADEERPSRPRATVETDITRFIRIVLGETDPKKLLLLRRLKVHGDLLWAKKALSLFEKPEL